MHMKYLLVLEQDQFIKLMSDALIALVYNFFCILLPTREQPQG